MSSFPYSFDHPLACRTYKGRYIFLRYIPEEGEQAHQDRKSGNSCHVPLHVHVLFSPAGCFFTLCSGMVAPACDSSRCTSRKSLSCGRRGNGGGHRDWQFYFLWSKYSESSLRGLAALLPTRGRTTCGNHSLTIDPPGFPTTKEQPFEGQFA